ncbi:leukocyte receptor cluster member 1 homolog [Anneissia japonica]|uniref:leukocyte receptor cluster member 1 homolog n=1 Tax=Anneissia japonica TaxID=1529436 RepID=UPI0014258B8D|nr:leukocyte receptor cluster member 1 homolog [Anneissia japonica]XP_033107747.1 leukocyte receptor cluster member 1 homolog [Anneissia japonica]
MNILPKKSWHVLKKENIERVRRDEAKAAEEEKQKQARIALAEQEARTARLRQKARKNYNEAVKQQGQQGDDLALVAIDDQPKGHINFFKDIQEGKKIGGVNADHEAEKQAEKINYEKKIGLLTYLGQSSAEAQTVKPWYQESKRKLAKANDKLTTETSSVDVKRKKLLDPMEEMNQYLSKKSVSQSGLKMAPDRLKPSVVQPSSNTASKVEQPSRTNDDAINRRHHCRKEDNKRHKKHGKYKSVEDSDSEKNKKHKRHKSKHKKKLKKHHRKHRHQSHSSSSSNSEDSGNTPNTTSNTSIEKLRAERLKRETAERAKTERLLSGNTEETSTSPMSIPEKVESTRGRYNSQFHPELARKRHDRKNFYV